MKNNNDGSWREISFTPEQWARVPSTATPWHAAPADPGADDRLRSSEEVTLVLHAIIVSVLTTRQRQVVERYYLEGRTQVEVATELGISQATVSQHLKGRRRGCNRIGGAFRRIRKAIRKAADLHAKDESRYAEIMAALDALLDASITRRRARDVMDALAHGHRNAE
jgi:predicted transcriptional regulator